MKFNKILAPVALVFNALVTPAAFAQEPQDVQTLTPEEKIAFINCQLEGPSQKSVNMLMQGIEEAKERRNQQKRKNPSASGDVKEPLDDVAKALVDLYISMGVNYYGCGLDMNIDLKTLPPIDVSMKAPAAPRP